MPATSSPFNAIKRNPSRTATGLSLSITRARSCSTSTRVNGRRRRGRNRRRLTPMHGNNQCQRCRVDSRCTGSLAPFFGRGGLARGRRAGGHAGRATCRLLHVGYISGDSDRRSLAPGSITRRTRVRRGTRACRGGTRPLVMSLHITELFSAPPQQKRASPPPHPACRLSACVAHARTHQSDGARA